MLQPLDLFSWYMCFELFTRETEDKEQKSTKL